jgi:hypothetical protein
MERHGNTRRNPQSRSREKPNLQLVAKPALRLAGMTPDESMAPGEYQVQCETAWMESIGRRARVVLQYRVIDGVHAGTALRQWIVASDDGGVVSPNGRYARACSIALGRPLEVGDDVGDPARIFGAQIFLVDVGYRKTELSGGGKASDENALRCKDSADYLRIHEILARVEL